TETITTPTTTPAVEEQSDKATLGERNALKSAQSYLKYSGFSEKGLEDQLDYEGYTSLEINYAINNVEVDWNEEAYESAESYLKYSSFSKQELHDQLEYEGFTESQIQYALEQVGY
ncbi:Ltp family lipoprotein, partial [Candidatus Pacearchaeota archaeon]|nr:Ltp family lipoprotein [Candidatus Pacearchaeota archaeon]